MEDDSEAKQVAGSGVDCLAALQIGDLGRNVAGSAASHEHELSSRTFGQAEVSDHALASILPEEHVFGLEVAVHEALAVHGLHSRQQSAHHRPYFLRAELVLGLDQVVQLSSREQLHAEVE